MAGITGLTTATTSLTVDPIADTGGTTRYKRALAPVAATGLDSSVASQAVGTHVDDAAATLGTDAVVGIGALADETATDSVDEGDVGLLRMTLNRRLITAALLLDDAAFGIATDYVTTIGALADETSPDSVNEGDVGALRMTLARNLHVVNVADAATLTQVNSAATNTTLLSANANRTGCTIVNTDANDLYVAFTSSAATTSAFTVKIPTDGYFEFPQPVYRGQVQGIWSADGSGAAAITELT